MVIFQNSRWRPSAILDFRKCEFWPIGSLEMLIFHHGTKFGAKMLNDAQIMAQKRNSKWRPPPSWIYFRWLFLAHSRLSTVDLNLHTKFGTNISIGGWLMVTFQNPRWRPSAILDFRKSDFWLMGGLRLLIFHHDNKFGAKNVDRRPNWLIMAQKQNSKWRTQPSWIYFCGYFWHTADFPLLISTTTQNLVPIGISQSAADLW